MSSLEQGAQELSQEQLQQELELQQNQIQQNNYLKQLQDLGDRNEPLGVQDQQFYSNLYSKLPQQNIPKAYSVRKAHSKVNLLGDTIPEDSQVNFSNQLDRQERGLYLSPDLSQRKDGSFSQRSFSDTNLAQMGQQASNVGPSLDGLNINSQLQQKSSVDNSYDKLQDFLQFQKDAQLDVQPSSQQGLPKANSASYLPNLTNIKTSTENFNTQNQTSVATEEAQQQDNLRQQLLRQQAQMSQKAYDADTLTKQQLENLSRQAGNQAMGSNPNLQNLLQGANAGGQQSQQGMLQNLNAYMAYSQQKQQQQQQQYTEIVKDLLMKGQITYGEAQSLLQKHSQQAQQNQQAQLANLLSQQQNMYGEQGEQGSSGSNNNAYLQKLLPQLFSQQLSLQNNYASQPNLRPTNSFNSFESVPQNPNQNLGFNKQLSSNDLMLASQLSQNMQRQNNPYGGSYQNLNYLDQVNQNFNAPTQQSVPNPNSNPNRNSWNESDLLNTLLSQQQQQQQQQQQGGMMGGKEQGLNLNDLKQQLEGLSTGGGMRSIASAPSLSQLGQVLQENKIKEELRRGSRISRRMLDPNLEAQRKAQQEKMFKLNTEKVMNGEDKRTTLMVKNIPNKYTQKMLIQTIDELFKGQYDFFYLPIDFKNRCNVGYAFINMVKPTYIVPFFEKFHEKKWDKFNSEKVASITYARIQGTAALVAHFQNSSLMHEDKKYRPILMKKSDGNIANEPEALSPGSTVKPKKNQEVGEFIE